MHNIHKDCFPIFSLKICKHVLIRNDEKQELGMLYVTVKGYILG